MAEQTAPLVQVFVTSDPLTHGVIPEVWARIEGDTIVHSSYEYRLTGEGRMWHRRRWAAENYARQLQAAKLAELRAEVARIEGLRFGRPGS
ncbi:hypothetical protein MKK84_24475 [Methylobacterium sp. E-065]|uniref:hypothetical protein n=1 Tax=Methylobacterium sp. E-065 TaxID=2836583 RepID=UPI001FBA680D|nr:hypothetical protein [Methylobacterium sp. E-065]MCJ2020544.1 hypothetical protein [Methylobacterium sp. E-065]